MSRLWLGNFDFEHQLADSGYNRPAKLRALNAELSSHLLPLAETGDCVHFDEPLPDGFLVRAEDAGLVAPGIQVETCDVSSHELAPWGWSDAVAREAAQLGCKATIPPAGPRLTTPRFDADATADRPHWVATLLAIAVDRFRDMLHGSMAAAALGVNSRLYSSVMELEFGADIPGSRGIFEVQELDVAVQSAADIWDSSEDQFAWIVKADYGMSGRERIVGRGLQPDSATVNWMRRRLKRDPCLNFEPFVTSLEEVSTHWDVSVRPGEPPEFVGLTGLIGGHLGNLVTAAESKRRLGAGFQEPILEAARCMAVDVQQLGYFGPLGIDAMVYIGLDGAPAVRHIQDVNARWTMGRVALALADRVGRDADLHWLHVPTDQLRRRLGLRSEALAEFHSQYSLDVTDRWLFGSRPLRPDSSPLGQLSSLMDVGSGRTRLVLTSPLWIGDRPTSRTSVLCIAT